jgi:hypothetical protein
VTLYLAIFDEEEDEVAGWVLGHYSDYGVFRDEVKRIAGAHYPLLLESSDSDTRWTPQQAAKLRLELREILSKLVGHPPIDLKQAFEHTSEYRRGATTAADCFHNVDGEPLISALDDLCAAAIETGLDIVFQ